MKLSPITLDSEKHQVILKTNNDIASTLCPTVRIMAFKTPLRWLAIAPALLSLSLPSFILPAQANPLDPLLLSLGFPSSTPSGSGAPQRTAGGAPKRGSEACVAKLADLNGDGELDPLTPLTALMPISNIGTSLNPDPTLTIYMPRNSSSGVEIVVQKRTPLANPTGRTRYRYEEVYANILPAPESTTTGPRIVNYRLEGVNLEAGAVYEWTLAMLCENSIGNEEVISGLISCSLEDGSPLGCTAGATIPDPTTLNAGELKQQATAYANQAYWNEALQFSAQLRQFDRSDWVEFLESQELGCLADVPFADEVVDPNSPQAAPNWDPQCFVEAVPEF